MKHHAHFGLEHDPFVNRPSLEDWVGTRVHSGAEMRLRRAIAQGKALVVLTGESGSGKTMLVRRVLDGLDDTTVEPCAIAWMPGESGRLLSRIARQLGAEEGGDRTQTLARIYERLIGVHTAGRRAVVLLDGADAIESRTDVEDVRALLGFEHEDGALLVLVLVGSPRLDATVEAEPRLRDRVEVRVSLPRLDAESAREYVVERFRRANGDPTDIEPEAMAALHAMSRGLPRLLNTIADNALFEAWQRGSRRVGAADVGLAARDLRIAGIDGDDATHSRPSIELAPPARDVPPRPAASVPVIAPASASAIVAEELTFGGFGPKSSSSVPGDDLMGGYELPEMDAGRSTAAGETSDDLARALGEALSAVRGTREEDADVLELSQPILEGELSGGDEAADAAVVLDVATDAEGTLDLEGLVTADLDEPPKDDDDDDPFAELVIDSSR